MSQGLITFLTRRAPKFDILDTGDSSHFDAFLGWLCTDAKMPSVSGERVLSNDILPLFSRRGQCSGRVTWVILTPILTLSIAHSPLSPPVARP
ncbi:hypothetical protein VN97_g1837 [Penicillium thymicola]|uniref:Uncharacterized protein n=1 Tax=Penicillium thymicola TaxID=293382 RepID=A0AAI9TQB5_PENTH|nr:hypothetical protein VN97_g1837 [Penicillium thymicola]